MSQTLTPEVLWAQRSSSTDPENNYLLLSIMMPDCNSPKLVLESNFLELEAESPGHVGDENSHKYSLHVDFYDEVDPSKSLHKISNGQGFFLKIYKANLGSEYWPRLTKEKLKYHYIKTDFDKWVDEDEQDNVQNEDLGFGGGDDQFQQLLQGGGGENEHLQELLKQSGEKLQD